MKPLHTIVRRGHCLGMHQNIALDALPLVQTAGGKRLNTWLLRHYRRYLRGAVDPDVRIRDFQNQVIHVRDGFWGGAPRVAHQWYDRLQRYLRERRYSDAAHAAGVLSHYFTDPIHPLNTAYSAAEAVLHRPLTWSIDRDYQAIMRHWQNDELRVVFRFADGPGWLGAAMLHSAKFAHERFEMLIRSYRLDAALEDPKDGLTPQLRLVVAELFGLAITGWARVLERAASDAEAVTREPLQRASSLWPTMTATLRTPMACWRNRIKSKIEDLKVQLLVDEFRQTGDLKEHLPACVDIKRRVIKVYRDEKLYQRHRDRRRAEDLALRLESDRQRSQLSLRGRSIDALVIDARDLKRLKTAHIETLDDLCSRTPSVIAGQINAYWITDKTVLSWQQQAALVTQVIGLDATAAMVLVNAGYHTIEAIAGEQHQNTIRRVLQYVDTVDARRALRGRPTPSSQQIASWLELISNHADRGRQLASLREAS